MIEVDRVMVEEYRIEVGQMMENAGRILAQLAIETFRPRSVSILVGTGNNGGGGLVAGRYLHNRGVQVTVVLANAKLPLDSSRNRLETLTKLGVPILTAINESDLIIDALVGYRSHGAPYGRVATLIEEAKATGQPILALDIPTGFDLETGLFHPVSLDTATVLTLGLPKTHMTTAIHNLYVGDIGIPPEVFQAVGVPYQEIFTTDELVKV